MACAESPYGRDHVNALAPFCAVEVETDHETRG
jgi:hypothetical protein